MSIANLLLAIWLLLFGFSALGWLPVSGIVLGILAIITAIMILLTSVGVIRREP